MGKYESPDYLGMVHHRGNSFHFRQQAMNNPIPTRRWYLSAPLFWFLAGVGLLIGIAVTVLKPEWRIWWPL